MSTTYAKQFGSILGGGGGGGGGVTSLNAETGDVVLVAGANVTITPAGQNITIASSPGTTGNLTDAGTDGITVTGGTGAVLGSGTSIAQHVADTTHNGYLSSTDWNTFNGKQAALTIGNLTDAGTDGITVTGGTGAVIGSGTSISQHVADATHNGYLSSTDWSTFNAKGSGTVTAVSVASSNGFAGSSSGGATPALTLSTSITGVLKGNGTAISAATAGTDYSAGTSALATGILKSTTATGALTIAASGTDYAPATSGSSILYGNGSGGFSNVTVGSGLTFSTGTLSASGGGGSAMAVLTKTASYTVVAPGDFTGGRLMVEMNATSAATLTLPAASNTGYEICVINIGSAICTVATAGSDTFGTTGDTTWTLIPGGSPQASNYYVANGVSRWNGF